MFHCILAKRGIQLTTLCVSGIFYFFFFSLYLCVLINFTFCCVLRHCSLINLSHRTPREEHPENALASHFPDKCLIRSFKAFKIVSSEDPVLYYSANAYALSNLHLCLLYSRNHRSILPFVCGLFRFEGMWLTPRAFRYCSNRLTPSSSSLRHLHRTECLDPYLLRLYNPDTLLLAFLHA
jgi:hypothetical protein